jgi:hypothetical protein
VLWPEFVNLLGGLEQPAMIGILGNSQFKLHYAFLSQGAVALTISWPFPRLRDESSSTCNHQAIRTRPFAA